MGNFEYHKGEKYPSAYFLRACWNCGTLELDVGGVAVDPFVLAIAAAGTVGTESQSQPASMQGE